MIAFAGRCLRVWSRDRTAIFFSLFGPLILLVLYIAFFGKMNVDSLMEGAADYGGGEWMTRSAATGFVASWVGAALIAVATINGPMVGLNLLVDDRVSGRMTDFLVAPLRQRSLMGGYLLATWVYTMAIVLVVAVVGVAGGLVLGARLPGPGGWLTLLVLTALGSLVYSAIYLLLSVGLRTQAAAGGVATVIGTLSGFLAGAYIPPGVLGTGMITGMNLMPFAPNAVVARQALAGPGLEDLPVPAEQITFMRNFYGMDLEVGGSIWPNWTPYAIMAAWGLVAFVLAIKVSSKLRQPA
ncbi:MAG: ABC transporter permease [Micrococcales bacterium]|nr:ABC transporter permease [Micrococcales bacterium]